MEKAEKRKSSCRGSPRERMVLRILTKAIVKQSRSCRPNEIPVGSTGDSTVIGRVVSEQSCTGREQRNLNLGGNTDRMVRPKLTSGRFRAFFSYKD